MGIGKSSLATVPRDRLRATCVDTDASWRDDYATAVTVGGLFDVAGREGIAQQSGDFGQTLFVWGVAEGPYVVLPYMGPSTTRDALGSIVDMVGNPLGWLVATQIAVSTTQMAVSAGTTGIARGIVL